MHPRGNPDKTLFHSELTPLITTPLQVTRKVRLKPVQEITQETK